MLYPRGPKMALSFVAMAVLRSPAGTVLAVGNPSKAIEAGTVPSKQNGEPSAALVPIENRVLATSMPVWPLSSGAGVLQVVPAANTSGSACVAEYTVTWQFKVGEGLYKVGLPEANEFT